MLSIRIPVPTQNDEKKNKKRAFLERSQAEYLFTYVEDRPVCLVFGANVAITKEYNIRRRYKTKHQDKYKNLKMTQNCQKVEEMKRNLVSQQIMFRKAISQSEAAVMTSFIVSPKIAKSSRHFNEEEFVKKGMPKICDLACPEKKQAFLNVSLRRSTVADHLPPIYITS